MATTGVMDSTPCTRASVTNRSSESTHQPKLEGASVENKGSAEKPAVKETKAQTPDPNAPKKLAKLEQNKKTVAKKTEQEGSYQCDDKGIKVKKTSKNDGTYIDTSKLKKIGEGVVGDRWGSKNSPKTASMSNNQTPKWKDVANVSVKNNEERVATPKSTHTDYTSYQPSYSQPSYRMRYNRSPRVAEGFGPVVSECRPSRPQWRCVEAPRATSATRNNRYVINAYDVDNMGGMPSRVFILDRNTREVLKVVELKPGNSQFKVDLPNGDYTFMAASGFRKDKNAKDARDNFRLEVFDANQTPEKKSKTDEAKGKETGDKKAKKQSTAPKEDSKDAVDTKAA